MSAGNISKLNTVDKNILIFSIFIENKIPKKIPVKVAKNPIEKPVKKKDFFIEALLSPNVFKIAISLVLFLINIVKPDIILNAATIIIKVKMINITFLSTLRALKRDLFKSDQVYINKFGFIISIWFLYSFAFKGSDKYNSIFWSLGLLSKIDRASWIFKKTIFWSNSKKPVLNVPAILKFSLPKFNHEARFSRYLTTCN